MPQTIVAKQKPIGPGPELVLIGSCDFNSADGRRTAKFCEILARYFFVRLMPLEVEWRAYPCIELPSGQLVETCKHCKNMKVSMLVAPLWNAFHPDNFFIVPNIGFRYAYFAWHSDQLPGRTVRILDDGFETILVPSRYMEKVLRESGVCKPPIEVVPLALDIEGYLSQPLKAGIRHTITFATVTSLNPRKGDDRLMEAFALEFSNASAARLRIYAAGAEEQDIAAITRQIKALRSSTIELITGPPEDDEPKIAFLQEADIFVTAAGGEGYSREPLEAMALGKTVVVVDAGAHAELPDLAGVFKAAAGIKLPVRYPEISNLAFGQAAIADMDDLRLKLRLAQEFVQSGRAEATAFERRVQAAESSSRALGERYAELIYPDLDAGKKINPPTPEKIEKAKTIEHYTGRHFAGIAKPYKKIIPATDGGIFSVINNFMS